MTVSDLRVLVDNLDEYIHIPGGIERLKKTILHLAVSGQLVRQDPSEGTGEELLKQVQSVLKPKKPLPVIKDIPFDIPNSWQWVRLGNLSSVGTGATPTRDNSSYYGGNIPWVTSTLTSKPIINKTQECITEKALAETNCSVYPKGSLVIAMYGQGKTRGQVSELGIDAATNQACAVFVKNNLINMEYIRRNLEYNYDSMRLVAAGGAQPNLNVQKIKEIQLPLPPIAEQNRITERVDEIYALIDELEARYKTEEVERTKLVRSSLWALSHNGSKIALENLTDTIKTKADAAQLRKAILHLAVSGKLVNQDHSDGTGEDLYKQILSKNTKRLMPLSVKDEDKSFEIPSSWRWVRLPDIYNSISPITKLKTADYLEVGKYPIIDQGQRYIAGYTNSGELNMVTTPVIIFGDHTREIKLVDFDFIVGADGVKILEPILVDSKFFYILVDVFRPQSRGYGRHFKMLNDKVVPLPPLAEQKRIVAKTTKLLDLVTELEKHLEK